MGEVDDGFTFAQYRSPRRLRRSTYPETSTPCAVAIGASQLPRPNSHYEIPLARALSTAPRRWFGDYYRAPNPPKQREVGAHRLRAIRQGGVVPGYARRPAPRRILRPEEFRRCGQAYAAPPLICSGYADTSQDRAMRRHPHYARACDLARRLLGMLSVYLGIQVCSNRALPGLPAARNICRLHRVLRERMLPISPAGGRRGCRLYTQWAQLGACPRRLLRL